MTIDFFQVAWLVSIAYLRHEDDERRLTEIGRPQFKTYISTHDR